MQTILLIGGDNRTKTAAQNLKEAGFAVDTLGLFYGDNGQIEDAHTVVFPVPATRDFETVNCALTDKKIYFRDIEERLSGKRILSGGKIPVKQPYTDYCADDEYAILNAVPTAEGAISFCIQNTPFTLYDSKILVVGYGRVAKILVSRLLSFKPDITVSARNRRDFGFIKADGLKYINTKDVLKQASSFDIIFNTVDAYFFEDLNVLESTLLIDLSSKGCTDFEAARQKGIKAYKLPGIPGKTAPETAGNILSRTLISLITENR